MQHETQVEYALEINHVGFSYRNRKKNTSIWSRAHRNTQPTNNTTHTTTSVEAIHDMSFKVTKGEFVVLGGGEGCGKSTLLRLIAGFDHPHVGEIYVNNTLYSSPKYLVDPEFRKIGLVFQDFALFPQMTVAQNICFGISHLSKEEQQYKINQILRYTTLMQHIDSYPHEISTADMQIVALARALVIEPLLLLVDEPFSQLDDTQLSMRFVELLQEMRSDDLTILLATSEMKSAVYLADNIKMLHTGQLIQEGSPEEIYIHPVTREIAGYFDEINLVPVTQPQVPTQSISSPLGDIHTSRVRNYAQYQNTTQFHLCIRPSMLQITHISKPSKQTNTWKVKNIIFMGSTYKIVLECTHEPYLGLKIVVVQGIETELPHAGEIVCIQIISKEAWALD